MPEFEGFAKIPRLRRNCVITEKIDGSNAQIHITDEGEFLIGSRNAYITPESDNFGFARWATANKEELLKLGPGRHYGEWWGSGIQRRYGLTGTDKRFSLFNVGRWRGDDAILPACVSLVPILYEGVFTDQAIEDALSDLRSNGSKAAPGFMQPEGVIIYHAAVRSLFKVTLEKDEEPKGFLA